jgi:hypothetical protein
MDLAPMDDLALTNPGITPQTTQEPRPREDPGPDPKDPREPRVPPSEPADAWALDRARKEVAAVRLRAQKAEESAIAGAARAKELEESLALARVTAAAAERGRRIDQELFEGGSIDLETTRLLVEAAVARMEEPDVALAVRELRRRKPFLFRGAGLGAPTAARFAEEAPSRAHDSIDEVSEKARASGDRMALLRYLRMKRGV